MLGKYKKRWLSYLNKENFDYTQGVMDPFEYHTFFLVFGKLFSVMDYEKLPLWMYISPVSVIIIGIFGGSMSIISFVHYAQSLQVNLMTECGTYFLIMVYMMFMVSCTFTNKTYYHKFQRAMRDDFRYINTKGLKYRDRFFDNQKLTFKACVLSAIFTISIGSGITICSWMSLGFYLIFFSEEHGAAGRPLPYPFWIFDYDLQATPFFEITFAMSSCFTLTHTYTYTFMMPTQILWVRQIMCKADLVRWSIQDLMDGITPAKNEEDEKYYASLVRYRMREIISIHHSMLELMNDYAAVYKKLLLFEQKLAAPILCMTSFSASKKFDAGEFEIMLILLCIAVIVLVFIPCYLCTFLLEKVQSISDACWDIPFWNAGPVVRPYLVLIMQRSMRPLPIVAAGFEDISLQTFSNIMTRAYSCFNMLRQGNF